MKLAALSGQNAYWAHCTGFFFYLSLVSCRYAFYAHRPGQDKMHTGVLGYVVVLLVCLSTLKMFIYICLWELRNRYEVDSCLNNLSL